jgi:hypothetical protein
MTGQTASSAGIASMRLGFRVVTHRKCPATAAEQADCFCPRPIIGRDKVSSETVALFVASVAEATRRLAETAASIVGYIIPGCPSKGLRE